MEDKLRKMKNKIHLMLGTALIFLSLLSLAYAFGVSSDYWEGNPMKISPGEAKIVNLNLQNIANAQESVKASVTMVSGSEIASLEKNEYLVAAGASTDVPLAINIPASAKIGDVYKVKVEVKTIPASVSGAVGMGTGMSVSFDVIIEEKPSAEKAKSNILVYIIIAIIIIALIAIIVRKKKFKFC